MWNDRETDTDLLGHVSLARTIADLIREVSLSPLTIGVYGDWGAGKSSILRLVENELKGDDKTCCLSFNGWLFQGYEDTKSVLMQAIITELENQQPTNEVLKNKARDLLKRVDWLKLARGATSLAWSTLTGTPDPLTLATVFERFKAFVEKPPEGMTSEQVESVARAVQDSIKENQRATVPEEIADLFDGHALAKLMLLERFNENVYSDIVGFMAKSNEGRISELRAFEQLAPKDEAKPRIPKAKAQAPGCPAPWLEDEWLRAWARIEPPLGDLDLRPYVFVSREKTPGFTTEVLLGATLEKIAGRLASGQPLMLAAMREELKGLHGGDTRKLFNHLGDRARQAPDWKTKPKELDGLYELCKHHPELQQELVGMFENLPVRELGAWAATGMKTVLTDETARERFQRLSAQWRKQLENQILRKAVEQLGEI